MERIFLDTNVLIDIVTERPGYEYSSRLVLDNSVEKYLSSLTIMNTAYICKLPKEVILQLCEPFYVVDLSERILQEAAKLELNDFEDAVQMASCMEVSNILITWDKKDFNNAPKNIKILSPKEYVAKVK